MSGVRHRDYASKWSGSMRAGHFASVAPTAVIRGEAGLGFARSGGQEKKSKGQRSSIHDALLKNEPIIEP
jgi:hypothetical protein